MNSLNSRCAFLILFSVMLGCSGPNGEQLPDMAEGPLDMARESPDDMSASEPDARPDRAVDMSDGAGEDMASPDMGGAGDPEDMSSGSDDLSERVEQVIQSWHSREIYGVGAVITRGDTEVVAGGWGYERGAEPLTVDTVFEVGSVTKMFAAALVHDAVARGELAWDDSVSKHLTDFALGDDITIEHLIQQTSGIFNYTASSAFTSAQYDPWTHEQLRALFETRPLAFEPGEAFDYSNSNYYLAGLVLEQATGEAFDVLLSERIAQPLGLTRTGMCDTDDVTTPRAQGHRKVGFALQEVRSVHMSGPYAAGAVCSTPEDISSFAREFYSGRWFSRAELAETPTFDGGTSSPYSWATFVGRLDWRPTLSHGGSIAGFTSDVVYFPEQDLTVVVLSNSQGVNLSTLVEQIAQEVDPQARPPIEQALTPEQIAAFTGVYSAEALPPLEIKPIEDGIELFVQGTTLALVRVGEADFETDPELLRLRFNGDILEVEQNGILLSLRKE